MARVYASTSPRWLEFHRLQNSQRVCFWQPTPAYPEKLEFGDRWYFCRRGSKQIDGYGTFAFWEKFTIREAWNNFGEDNGCESEDELLRLIVEATPAEHEIDLNSEIGCVVLVEVAYFGKVIDLNKVGLRPLNVRFEYLDDEDPIESFLLGLGVQGDVERGFRLCDEAEVKRSEKFLKDRTGQAAFRKTLREVYGDNCALSGSNPPVVLDAAHIQPYANDASNHVENGLLLRADLHRLFDAGVFYVDENLVTRFDENFIRENRNYFRYERVRLTFADIPDIRVRPSKAALKYHRDNVSKG